MPSFGISLTVTPSDATREELIELGFRPDRVRAFPNGVDSFFAIRALRPNAKVVLMTGYEESMVARALAAGALGLLTKPFQMDDLLTKLADATRPVVLVADDDADFVESLADLLWAVVMLPEFQLVR